MKEAVIRYRVTDNNIEELRETIEPILADLEGKPAVHVSKDDRAVFHSRVFDLELEEDGLAGECEWMEPEDQRPDELTDGISISVDLLEISPKWIYDDYFRWWLVFDPAIVEQSENGDHSWVDAFIDSDGASILEG